MVDGAVWSCMPGGELVVRRSGGAMAAFWFWRITFRVICGCYDLVLADGVWWYAGFAGELSRGGGFGGRRRPHFEFGWALSAVE